MEQNLADQLGRVLRTDHHQVTRGDALDSRVWQADVIFFGADGDSGTQDLAIARRVLPQVPCVVVTRRPETRQWLDALEDGATDYCAAPFERRQIRWILQSVLHRAA
jgi:DNA-binding response OmpR family regulator